MLCLLLRPRQAFRSLQPSSHLFYSGTLPLYTWTVAPNSMRQGWVINSTQMVFHQNRVGCSYCRGLGSRPLTSPLQARMLQCYGHRQQWPLAEPSDDAAHLTPEVTSAEGRSDQASPERIIPLVWARVKFSIQAPLWSCCFHGQRPQLSILLGFFQSLFTTFFNPLLPCINTCPSLSLLPSFQLL